MLFRPSPHAALLVSALLLLSVAACGKKNEQDGDPSQRPAPEVGFVELKAEVVPLRLELPGRTAAFEVSEVRPQVSGLIQARLFTEGALVQAGDVLYRIDPRVSQSALGQARADLASSVATRDAERARAGRLAELAQSGIVSKQDLLDAQAAADAASANAMRAEAQLETAKVNLGFTRVTAPITGRIGRSVVTTGALVTAGQPDPLTTIQRLDPIFVDIQQSSSALLSFRRQLAGGGLARSSTSVNLILEDGSQYPHEGVLQFAESVVDPGTGTVTVRARFPNPEGFLLPGMYVRAAFSPVEAREAILAPQQGISRDAKGQATAMVVGADSKAELRTVVTERTVGDKWLVSSGLRSGDRLIIEGLSKVQPGQAVRAVAATAQPAPAATPAATAQPAPASSAAR